MLPPNIGDGVLGSRTGGDHGSGSSFSVFSFAAAFSSARAESLTAPPRCCCLLDNLHVVLLLFLLLRTRTADVKDDTDDNDIANAIVLI